MLLRVVLGIVVLGLLGGCSARQVTGKLPGAQEQRLVTHALDDLIEALPAEDFEPRRGLRVLVEPVAIADANAVKYAVRRLETELLHKYAIQPVASADEADFTLRVFFEALGTDFDTAGFSIPLAVVPNAQYTTDLKLLAVDMYHGVAEWQYYILNPQGQVLVQRGPMLARERIDKLATPILSFPINTVD